MIPKVTSDVVSTFTAQIQAQILYYIATKTDVSLQYVGGSIIITSGNAALEWDNSVILCSSEWVTIMSVLNNLSSDAKKLILRVLEKFSSKLLLMINVVLLMHHCDIIFVVLGVIFDELLFSQTYEVCTYINNNGRVESVVCYSRLCGFEYNPYRMSEHFINYFNSAHDTYDHAHAKEKPCCDFDLTMDTEQKLYLLMSSNMGKNVIVGKVNGLSASIFVYFFDSDLSNDQKWTVPDISYLSSVCSRGQSYHTFFTKVLNVCDVDIRIYHDIIDGKLC